MKTLNIRWQRVLDDKKQTCNRCSDTEAEMKQAVETLRPVLLKQGIVLELEMAAMTEAEFQRSPTESNRIWIQGKPLETWLDATAGSNPCEGVCAGNECRTLDIDGGRFEAVKAGYLEQAIRKAAETL
ncbi:MAG: DUF2703 domain-containing protein [Neisseria sp.]|uniref:DUF2703 domain-containing protein n=1 Tax=Neisseria sp. TaxID=192066 RepID=UPI0026DD5647|nr:DUF2703 domain-containing protein [Neisseria sp.]MDO4640668.1 DUF2703 domain-containing protein [Neisseria sp.]